MEILLGLFGALLGAGLFCAGFYVGTGCTAGDCGESGRCRCEGKGACRMQKENGLKEKKNAARCRDACPDLPCGSAAVPGPDEAAPAPEAEADRLRREEEKRAFDALMGYSADVAYGNTRLPEV